MKRSTPGVWNNLEVRRVSENELSRILKVLHNRSRRIANEAAALGFEWEAVIQRASDAERDGDEEHRRSEEQRGRMVHFARCAKLDELADVVRTLYRHAAGDLFIDGETAGTSLSERALNRIAEVSGSGEWI